jgi:hypothetical protein
MKQVRNNVKKLKNTMAQAHARARAALLWMLTGGAWLDKLDFASYPCFLTIEERESCSQLWRIEHGDDECSGKDDQAYPQFVLQALQSLVNDGLCEAQKSPDGVLVRRVSIDQASEPVLARMNRGFKVGLEVVSELLEWDWQTRSDYQWNIAAFVEQETLGLEGLPVLWLLMKVYDKQLAEKDAGRATSGPAGDCKSAEAVAMEYKTHDV